MQQRTASLEHALQELSTANQQLAELSRHDSLTGLFNRQVLNEELERMLAQAKRSQQPIAMLMMDLDTSSRSTTVRPPDGDACLQHAAQRMQQRMRSSRPAGSLWRRGVRRRALRHRSSRGHGLAEQLRDDLASHPCQHQGLSISMSLSIGVYALIPDAREQPRTAATPCRRERSIGPRPQAVIGSLSYEASALDDA